MVEVRLRRQIGGCLYWPLAICSFGLFILALSFGEKHFIRRMENWGVTSRGGKRIGWNEFTAIERRQGTMKGTVLSDEYLLKSPKGNVSLPLWRTENAQEAKDFMFHFLPPSLFQGGRQ